MSAAECEVCATPYHSSNVNPRLLRCGHTICGSCVAHLIKIRSFFCPFCRDSCRSIKSENELPLNRFILDLIEKENTDICDNNNVNNCLKNLDKGGLNESLNSNNSAVIPSSVPVVHAGVCQEHGYYRDMRCTSCNVSICKQCTFCDHPQNTCRVIPITKANLENHVRLRAKEKSHAVMHNCKYITDNLLTRLPRLEAAAKRQAKAVESLQSELEFQQLLQKEVDDHVANMKDVLHEGQKRQEVLQRTQQYIEDLENAQNENTNVDNNSENQDDGNKKSNLETSSQTSTNEAQSSDITCGLIVEESSIVNKSNKTEESISNSTVKCCDSSTPELENTLNLIDSTENILVKVSDIPEEIPSSTSNIISCGSGPQNSENNVDNTSNDIQVSFEQINEQVIPMPDSTTEHNVACTTSNDSQVFYEETEDHVTPAAQADSTKDSPLPASKADITQVQITTLEDVQKIQKETEHFIQASQYLPWNRTASKVKKTQAIVFHAVELLDLCRTTQGNAPLVDGYLDDDYESEESEDDYDYDDENNGGEEEDADHTSEDEDDDFSDDGVVVVESLEGPTEEDKTATHQNHSQVSQEQQLIIYNDKRFPIIRTLLVPFTSLFSGIFSAFNGFKEMMTLPQLLDPHADEKDNLYIDQLFL